MEWKLDQPGANLIHTYTVSRFLGPPDHQPNGRVNGNHNIIGSIFGNHLKPHYVNTFQLEGLGRGHRAARMAPMAHRNGTS